MTFDNTIEIGEYLTVPPNWKDPYFQKRKWRTDIQKSIQGQEKRSAKFSFPRRSQRFSILCMSLAETNYLRRKLFKNLRNNWGVPIWPEWTQLTSAASIGQYTLEVGNTLNRTFEKGGRFILLGDIGEYESGIISDLTETSITLNTALNVYWPKNTYVYPLLPCSIGISQNVSPQVSGIDALVLECIELPDCNKEREPFLFAEPTYNEFLGYPVFDRRPNWITPLNIDYNHMYDIMEYFGPAERTSNLAETELILTGTYLNVNNQELNDFLGFFDLMMGRWGLFWFSTYNDDIQITVGFLATATTFTILNIEWTSYFGINEIVGKHIIFWFPDGSKTYRTIISAPNATSITINTPVGKAISTILLKRMKVSFLLLGRFDLDEVEYMRITGEASNITLKFASVYGTDLL